MSKIIDRIERELGLPGLATTLADRLDGSDLQSLLLEVYRRRAAAREPSAILADYTTNRFVQPSDVAPRLLAEWDRTIEAHVPATFERLDLSPVTPLGASSVVASVTQDWAVATARNTEVVSDSTNVLALEAAVRRREALRRDPKSIQPIHLATNHRLLRPQQVDHPDMRPHFSLFALCSGCRDLGSHRFELAAIRDHVRAFVPALQAFLGTDARIRVTVSEFATLASSVEDEVLNPIAGEFPGTECVRDRARRRGRGYYSEVCFSVDVADSVGAMINVADGGAVPWAGRLLSNAKERLVVGGIGSDMVCRLHTRR